MYVVISHPHGHEHYIISITHGTVLWFVLYQCSYVLTAVLVYCSRTVRKNVATNGQKDRLYDDIRNAVASLSLACRREVFMFEM